VERERREREREREELPYFFSYSSEIFSTYEEFFRWYAENAAEIAAKNAGGKEGKEIAGAIFELPVISRVL